MLSTTGIIGRDGVTNQQAVGRTTLKSAKVLIVEDVTLNLMLVRKLLEGMCPGCTVFEAANGYEALAMVRTHLPDLVLMDVHMPEMDGITAAREIRGWEQQNGLKTRPILALSAGVLDEERELCLQAGMDAFLSKPVEAEGLRAVLNRYIID